MPYPGRATPTFSKATQATLSRRRAPDLEPILTGAGTAQLSGRLSPSTVHRPPSEGILVPQEKLVDTKKTISPFPKKRSKPPCSERACGPRFAFTGTTAMFVKRLGAC
jgi:hypothetical protein